MNTKFLCLTASLFLLVSCNNTKKDEAATDTELVTEDVDKPIDEKESKKQVTDRDFSITRDNAYNDMFLDSLAMERYIIKRELADKKIARRIRSFYNARNYQYAWFSTKGLTEQSRFFWNQYDYAVTHLKDTSLVNSAFYKQADRYLNMEKMTTGTKDSLVLNTEFGFTEHFLKKNGPCNPCKTRRSFWKNNRNRPEPPPPIFRETSFPSYFDHPTSTKNGCSSERTAYR